MKLMHLWVPEDRAKWGRPRVIEVGSKPPRPGKVYELQAKSANDARRIFALVDGGEPDRKTERSRWLDWDDVKDSVREVKRG